MNAQNRRMLPNLQLTRSLIVASITDAQILKIIYFMTVLYVYSLLDFYHILSLYTYILCLYIAMHCTVNSALTLCYFAL